MIPDHQPYGASPAQPGRKPRGHTWGSKVTTLCGCLHVVFTGWALIACAMYDRWPIPWPESVSELMKLSMLLMVTSFLGAVSVGPLALVHAKLHRPRMVLLLLAYFSFALWPTTWYLRWYDAFGVGV